jgi:hypothetical protein
VKVHGPAPVLGPEVVVGGGTERVVQQTRGHRGPPRALFCSFPCSPDVLLCAHLLGAAGPSGRLPCQSPPVPGSSCKISRRAAEFAEKSAQLAEPSAALRLCEKILFVRGVVPRPRCSLTGMICTYIYLQMNRHGRGRPTTFPYPVPPAGSRRAKPALFTFPGEIGVDAPSNSA